MELNQITLQRGLTKLKIFKEEARSEILGKDYGGVFGAGKNVQNGKTFAECNEAYAKNRQSVKDKLDSVFAIRNKINEVNFNTFVDVPELGRIRISEAVTYKNMMLPHLKLWLNDMTSQYQSAMNLFKSQHDNWQRNRDELAKNTQASVEVIQTLLKDIDTNEPKLEFDTTEIDKLKNLIKFLSDELNLVLSEINATTVIDLGK